MLLHSHPAFKKGHSLGHYISSTVIVFKVEKSKNAKKSQCFVTKLCNEVFNHQMITLQATPHLMSHLNNNQKKNSNLVT